MTTRPPTLGLIDWRERHKAARRQAFEQLRRQWLDAIQLGADPQTIRQLAELVGEAARA